MNLKIFSETEAKKLPNLLQALWYDAKGDWHNAHEIAQSREGVKEYDQLHAYLHRKEGDNWNANYWYRRCGETMPKVSLDEEWEIRRVSFKQKRKSSMADQRSPHFSVHTQALGGLGASRI